VRIVSDWAEWQFMTKEPSREEAAAKVDELVRYSDLLPNIEDRIRLLDHIPDEIFSSLSNADRTRIMRALLAPLRQAHRFLAMRQWAGDGQGSKVRAGIDICDEMFCSDNAFSAPVSEPFADYWRDKLTLLETLAESETREEAP
jgi:hypothetical protein